LGATYEKVTPSERNAAFRIPFLAVQEVEGIVEDTLFHTSVEDDRREGAFGTRSDETPFIPSIRSIDGNLLCLGFLPAFFGFRENVLNELMRSTQYTIRGGQLDW
jgi:hypothetical protein